MGLMDFFKDAGEKLFGHNPSVEDIKKYIEKQGLSTKGLDLQYDKNSNRITIAGTVPDQATKEKLILCCGNIYGVSGVDDRLTVNTPAPPSQYYTVQNGDTLSKIALKFYGDSKRYTEIFEANRPMLAHPDKIYPGQSLRIPKQGPEKTQIAEQRP